MLARFVQWEDEVISSLLNSTLCVLFRVAAVVVVLVC